MDNIVSGEIIYKPLEIGGVNLGRVDREQFFADRCHGKKVLHVGCTDYPLTKVKFELNQLLHQKLISVAKELHGIDLSEEGISFLSDAKIPNLFVCDVENLGQYNIEQKFDVVVAGELLEHLNNVGNALENLNKLLIPDGELLISVPNAFSVELFMHMVFFKREKVHKDHCCYYSPKTIYRTLTNHGFKVVMVAFTNRESIKSLKWKLIRTIEDRFPILSRSVIITAKKDKRKKVDLNSVNTSLIVH